MHHGRTVRMRNIIFINARRQPSTAQLNGVRQQQDACRQLLSI